jgi:hypothetical protein
VVFISMLSSYGLVAEPRGGWFVEQEAILGQKVPFFARLPMWDEGKKVPVKGYVVG